MRISICGLGVALVACGSAPTDPDAGPPNVTVTVYGIVSANPYAVGPLPGIDVVFAEADGTLDGTVTTDADGKARAHIGPGASATSVQKSIPPGGGGGALMTTLGLQPGDDVVIGSRDPVRLAAGSFTVSFTPPAGGASVGAVLAGCGASQWVTTSPATIYYDAACDGKPTPLSLVAYGGGATPSPIAYQAPVSVVVSKGGSYTASGTWSTPASLDVSVTDVAEATFSVERCNAIACGTGGAPIAGGTGSAQVPVIPGGPAWISISAAYPDRPNGAHAPFPGAYRTLAEPIAADATTYAIDVGARFSPVVSSCTLDATGRMVTCAAAADLGGDALTFDMPVAGWNWQVIGPPVSPTILPALPASLGVVLPGKPWELGASVIDWSDVAGWDVIRQDPWQALAHPYDPPTTRTVRTSHTGVYNPP